MVPRITPTKLVTTVSARQTPSLNRLFSLNNAGIRIHSGSGGPIHSRNSWTPRTSITTYNGPHTFGSNKHWHDQLVQNLVQTPNLHIYAPNTIEDYDLRLRPQLMLPPKHTGFLLIPCHHPFFHQDEGFLEHEPFPAQQTYVSFVPCR